MKRLYYAVTDRGCCIRKAENIEQARKLIIREVGEYGVKSVSPAKQSDIDWVKGMGGKIPD